MTAPVGRRGARAGPLIEALNPALLRDPIAYLVADHYRQRAVLNLIDTIARGRTTPEIRRRIAAEVVSFVRVDLARHVADEERDLFRLLLRRGGDDHSVVDILEQLRCEHAADDRALRELVDALVAMVDRPGAEVSVELRVTAHGFVEGQRRHLAWENAIVVPALRRHLTAGDLRILSRRMAARRGIKALGARRASG